MEHPPTIPSIYIMGQVFKSFGEITVSDIPCLDQYRKNMKPSITGITQPYFDDKTPDLFETYIQFKEYIGFTNCMFGLQGKKLVLLRNNRAWITSINVDFDKTRHLSDNLMKIRALERQQLIAIEKEEEKEDEDDKSPVVFKEANKRY